MFLMEETGMPIYNLDTDEAVILQTSGVFTEGKTSVDLVLTSKSLIQINKGFFGGNKGYVKYSLSDLKVLNGKANILVGKSRNGSKQMEVYFASCELYYRFGSTFVLNKWVNAIIKAHKERMIALEKSQKDPKNSLIETFKEKLDKVIPGKDASMRTCKCLKCGAELIGNKGEVVICVYCDNAMIIK